MIKIPLKVDHHRAASWRPDEGLTLNSGQVALRFFSGSGPVLLRKPIFVIFQGWSGPPARPPPPLDPPMPVKKFSVRSGCFLG